MRNVSQDLLDEFASQTPYPVLLAELHFDSGTVYMFTGYGTLDYNGNTYIGGGKCIGISKITESQDTKANGVVVSLNGLDSGLVALGLAERSRGRPFRLYLASITTEQFILTEDSGSPIPEYFVLQEDGFKIYLENKLVGTPYRIFSGLMDPIQGTEDGVKGDLSLAVENILIIGQRQKIGRYTHEDQQRRYPGDMGLEFINQLQDKALVW